MLVLLFTCDDCIRLNGFGEVLLVDKQKNVQICCEQSHHSMMYGNREMDSIYLLIGPCVSLLSLLP